MDVVVVNLGVGNLRSVQQAVSYVAADANVSVAQNAAAILNADKLILPGQGAIGTWLNQLDKLDLRTALNTALSEKPVLAICVGMQALFEYCEEDGGHAGLALFEGRVRHFDRFHKDASISVPQIGWNQVEQTQSHPLWHGITDSAYFYFLHSYCANVDAGQSQASIVGQSDYHHQYISAVADKQVFAVQFHPEKSHHAGLTLFKNFLQWDGQT